MSFGIVITAYEEHRKPGYLERALELALDPRVDEVVVSDDCSLDWKDTVVRIHEFIDKYPKELRVEPKRVDGVGFSSCKIVLYSNEQNLGVFGNKLIGIRRATTDWVQSLDSDNCLSPAYLDVLFPLLTDPNRKLCPSFARPEFDYRRNEGVEISLGNFRDMLVWRLFGCMLNTGNQCLHRQTFLDVMSGVPHDRYDRWAHNYFSLHATEDIEHRKIYDSADSFCFNKLWLLAGKSLLIGKGLEYDHPVLEHSSWRAAPALKGALPPIYFQELVDRSQGRAPRKYQFKGYTNGMLGQAAVLVYRDEYGKEKQVYVDVNTGQQTVMAPEQFKKRRKWK